MDGGSGDNTGESRIMSVRSYEHIGRLAGLLTTGFNIVFQMRRKATDAPRFRAEARGVVLHKTLFSIVKIDAQVIPLG